MVVRRLLVVASVVAATLVALLPSPPASAAPAKDPVVIVPGFTTGPVIDTGYIPLRDRLRSAGYDVTMLVYPDYGLGDIRTNSQRLANTIASVRARTGAAKVDLVAHSMGGLVSRYYIKDLGGAATVDSLIMMGTPNYGTSLANVASFLTFGSCIGIDACNQMAAGSSLLEGRTGEIPPAFSPATLNFPALAIASISRTGLKSTMALLRLEIFFSSASVPGQQPIHAARCPPAEPPELTMRSGSIPSSLACVRIQRMTRRASSTQTSGPLPSV